MTVRAMRVFFIGAAAICVAGKEARGAADEPAFNRVSLVASLHPLEGQEGVIVTSMGANYAYAILPEIFFVLVGATFTNAMAGDRAGAPVTGSTWALFTEAGAEFAWPLMPGAGPFARAVAGYRALSLGGALRGCAEGTLCPSAPALDPFHVTGELGFRFSFVELFASAGIGPGRGFNAGFGLALSGSF
jgi:hypothetical protein